MRSLAALLSLCAVLPAHAATIPAYRGRVAASLPAARSTALSRRSALMAAAAATLASSSIAEAAQPATSAQRFSIEPRLTPLPPLGALARYEDQLSTPKGSKRLSVRVQFDFPTQWTPLDKSNGITYVDGATGLKTYILKAALPEGSTLSDVPKAWFGDAIFDPQGTIARGGTAIEEYKVSSSKLTDAPEDAAGPSRRRLGLKYAVVTPANQRVVERRAVVDAYEVDGVAYMLMASATGTKWESSEKERCERTADSFFIGL